MMRGRDRWRGGADSGRYYSARQCGAGAARGIFINRVGTRIGVAVFDGALDDEEWAGLGLRLAMGDRGVSLGAESLARSGVQQHLV